MGGEKHLKSENDFLTNVVFWNTIDQSNKLALERTAGR